MVIASSVVTDAGIPPEVVDSTSTEQDICIVQLVIVADPGSNRSPEELDVRVSSESSHLGWLTHYYVVKIS